MHISFNNNKNIFKHHFFSKYYHTIQEDCENLWQLTIIIYRNSIVINIISQHFLLFGNLLLSKPKNSLFIF